MEYNDINPNDILVFSFNDKNQNWQQSPEYNIHFLQIQVHQLAYRFDAIGHLFVNDALYRMGFEPIPEGQLVGWTQYMSQTPNIQVILEPLSVRMETDGFIWNKI